jgi:hypothetical protein
MVFVVNLLTIKGETKMDFFNQLSDYILSYGQPNLLLAIIIAVVTYLFWDYTKKFAWYQKVKNFVQIINAGSGSIISYVALGIISANWGTTIIIMALVTGFTAAAASVMGYEGIEKLIRRYLEAKKNQQPAEVEQQEQPK